ncbi:hypothetical protein H311_04380, partial [Anncaliia algerae PRA109]
VKEKFGFINGDDLTVERAVYITIEYKTRNIRELFYIVEILEKKDTNRKYSG